MLTLWLQAFFCLDSGPQQYNCCFVSEKKQQKKPYRNLVTSHFLERCVGRAGVSGGRPCSNFLLCKAHFFAAPPPNPVPTPLLTIHCIRPSPYLYHPTSSKIIIVTPLQAIRSGCWNLKQDTFKSQILHPYILPLALTLYIFYLFHVVITSRI